MHRASLKDASRIVVKLGTGVLTDSRKQPDLEQIGQLAAQIAAVRAQGKQVVIVSSGAVGAGMGALGYEKRPADVSELQACAAVGQPRLMALYEKLFAEAGFRVAQVLLTHDDLAHHERHLNARNTLVTLLAPRRHPHHQRKRRHFLHRIEIRRQRQTLRAGRLPAAGRRADHPHNGGRA